MIKVSVIIVTYNQEKYIAQAIESALCQETDFAFEIIIGEDNSSDNTRAIVKDFKKSYPKKIKLLLNSRKNVISIRGQATGKWNLVNCIKNATGEYVALLEGDDYWTDKHKLQKQADYLDKNPSCTLCQHKSATIREENGSSMFLWPCDKEELTCEDILRRNTFSRWEKTVPETHTSSIVMRKRLVADGMPPRFMEIFAGDRYLYLWACLNGNIHVLPEVMSVYRQHNQGISQKDWSDEYRHRQFWIDHDIGDFGLFKEILPFKYQAQIDTILHGLRLLAHSLAERNDLRSKYSAMRGKVEELQKSLYESQIERCISVWLLYIQPNFSRIALFGSGEHSQKLLQRLIELNLKLPRLIVDSRPGMKEIEGIPVYPYDERYLADIEVVALSTMTFQNEMMARIRQNGNMISVIDFYTFNAMPQ